MAEQLGCIYYHSSMRAYAIGKGGKPALYKERLQQWAEGRSSSWWIAVIIELRTGVDIQGIMAVIHIEQPYRLVDFVQQTGQGR